jgi:hypothetical protein
MHSVTSQATWWSVVRAMAEMVIFGYDELELTERYVRDELLEAGFSSTDIEAACDWVEKAVNSGTVVESLAMLQSKGEGVRITNPMERINFSNKIWSKIEMCRHKGILSSDIISRRCRVRCALPSLLRDLIVPSRRNSRSRSARRVRR